MIQVQKLDYRLFLKTRKAKARLGMGLVQILFPSFIAAFPAGQM